MVTMFLVLMWMLLFGEGRRQPFVYTDTHFAVRAYIIFPLLFATIAWFCFGHKWPSTGHTGYRMAMASIKTTGQRIRSTVFGLCGLVLISGGLAWTSVVVPIWVTVALGSEGQSAAYRVVQVSGSGRYREARLTRLSDGDSVSLPLAGGYASAPIRSGETVCATLRSSVLGAIATELQSGDCPTRR